MATGNTWRTALTKGTADGVMIRGYDLGEMVGTLSFAESLLLLATGELPTPGQARTLDALFVSVLDHGIVPSSIVTRYLASAGSPLQTSVAGGVMAFGDTYGGACEQLAEQLHLAIAKIDAGELDEEGAAKHIIAHFRDQGKRVPGYGHALHPDGDPRVPRLFTIATENEVFGRHCSLAQAVAQQLEVMRGKPLPMNQDGALGALGLDLGLDWRFIRALAFVPRSAGLAVHAVEEMEREDGWRHVPDAEVDYDGPEPRSLKADR